MLEILKYLCLFFKLAYKRFADNVPMLVDLLMLRRFYKTVSDNCLGEIYGDDDKKRNMLLNETDEVIFSLDL